MDSNFALRFFIKGLQCGVSRFIVFDGIVNLLISYVHLRLQIINYRATFNSELCVFSFRDHKKSLDICLTIYEDWKERDKSYKQDIYAIENENDHFKTYLKRISSDAKKMDCLPDRSTSFYYRTYVIVVASATRNKLISAAVTPLLLSYLYRGNKLTRRDVRLNQGVIFKTYFAQFHKYQLRSCENSVIDNSKIKH
jgi:hypothetical protein